MARSADRLPVTALGRPPAALRPRRSALLGVLAGLIGIGCCVYPTVLVLVGLSSAAAAVDLGNVLFTRWGWAFRSAGVGFALVALWLQRRRARSCSVDAPPNLAKNALWIVVVGIVTYAAMYAITTWLGNLAT